MHIIIRKISFLSILIAIVISMLIIFTSCIPSWKWNYAGENGYYRTQSGDVCIDFQKMYCTVKMDEETTYSIGLHNALIEIYLYLPTEECPSSSVTGEILTFSVQSNEKDKILHLTVSESKIEGLVGLEYDLMFYPGERYGETDSSETVESSSSINK